MLTVKKNGTHLNEDALEVLAHGDGADLDEKVCKLKAGAARLHARLLLVVVDGGHLYHEQVEEAVGHQGHRLGRRAGALEKGENGRRLLRVVQHVHRPRGPCGAQNLSVSQPSPLPLTVWRRRQRHRRRRLFCVLRSQQSSPESRPDRRHSSKQRTQPPPPPPPPQLHCAKTCSPARSPAMD